MTITRKRFTATITNRDTNETITLPLYDEQTADGTSGEGQAFKQAQALAKKVYPFARVSFAVDPVTLSAEIDIKKAVEAGAVGAWTVTE